MRPNASPRQLRYGIGACYLGKRRARRMRRARSRLWLRSALDERAALGLALGLGHHRKAVAFAGIQALAGIAGALAGALALAGVGGHALALRGVGRGRCRRY